MKTVKIVAFSVLLFALPVFSYFSSEVIFRSHFSAGEVDINLEETLSRRSKKKVVVKNTGSLSFKYRVQVLASDQCQFDLRVDRGDTLFYYGDISNFSSWRSSFMPVGDSAKWTFRGFSGDEDCKVNILFRAENGFSSFSGFRFLD